MSDHERIEELLVLEALDALEREGEEALAREVEAHGPDCEACAVLRREYRNAAGRLPFALDPVAVRDELGEDILKAGRPVLLARPAGPLRGRRLRALLVAAAAAAFAALGAVGGYVLAPRQDTEAAVLAAFLARPDVQVLRFEGLEGNLAAAVAPGEGGYLFGRDLPSLPRGMVFELWAIRDKTTAPRLCTRGGPTLIARFSGDVSGSDALAVTVEPEACPSRPTSDPIFVTPVTS